MLTRGRVGRRMSDRSRSHASNRAVPEKAHVENRRLRQRRHTCPASHLRYSPDDDTQHSKKQCRIVQALPTMAVAKPAMWPPLALGRSAPTNILRVARLRLGICLVPQERATRRIRTRHRHTGFAEPKASIHPTEPLDLLSHEKRRTREGGVGGHRRRLQRRRRRQAPRTPISRSAALEKVLSASASPLAYSMRIGRRHLSVVNLRSRSGLNPVRSEYANKRKTPRTSRIQEAQPRRAAWPSNSGDRRSDSGTRTKSDHRARQSRNVRAVVREPVTTELHKGYFGVPWSGNIFLHRESPNDELPYGAARNTQVKTSPNRIWPVFVAVWPIPRSLQSKSHYGFGNSMGDGGRGTVGHVGNRRSYSLSGYAAHFGPSKRWRHFPRIRLIGLLRSTNGIIGPRLVPKL